MFITVKDVDFGKHRGDGMFFLSMNPDLGL